MRTDLDCLLDRMDAVAAATRIPLERAKALTAPLAARLNQQNPPGMSGLPAGLGAARILAATTEEGDSPAA